MLGSTTFWGEVANSTVAAVVTTVGVVALGLMASYVLARYQFPARGLLYAVFAAGLMFPITVAVRRSTLVRNLRLMDSLSG